MEIRPILEMKNIMKSFGIVQVLKGVDLTLVPGQVLGLIGENGAGKSTLMKILCGVYKKDGGEIIYQGEVMESLSASKTQKLGISIIYQELSVLQNLTAAENIFINREKTYGKGGLFSPLKRAEMKEAAKKLLKEDMGIEIDMDIPAQFMSLAQRQMIEIAKCLVDEAKIIIMDEPTAALENHERDQLFKIIRRLKEKGTAIVFVSHALDEILEICDDIMILRDGNVVANKKTEEMDVDQIVKYMIGKPLEKQYPKYKVPIGDVIFKAEGVSDKKNFKNVTIEARAGEIVGIAGLEGCGKSEVIRSIFGINKLTEGKVYIHNNPVKIKNIHGAIRNKLAFIPSDRKVEGLFLDHDLKWNFSIASINKVIKGWIRTAIERAETKKYIDALSVKTTGPDQVIKDLSGGNQQKILISRWLFTNPDIIMMQEPTRGIDVNAKADVYGLMMKCAEEQKAVIMVSSEAPELLGMCDRIYVMYEGQIVGELSAEEANEETLTQYSVNAMGVN